MDAAAVNAMGSSSGWMTRCKIELNGRTRNPPYAVHDEAMNDLLKALKATHVKKKDGKRSIFLHILLTVFSYQNC